MVVFQNQEDLQKANWTQKLWCSCNVLRRTIEYGKLAFLLFNEMIILKKMKKYYTHIYTHVFGRSKIDRANAPQTF